MTTSSTPSKSAINPLAFLPFGIYMVASVIQIIAIRENLPSFTALLEGWVVPGVLLLAAGFVISQKIASIALSGASILWQLLVVFNVPGNGIEFLLPSSWLGYGLQPSVVYFTNLIAIFVAPILGIVMASTWKGSATQTAPVGTSPVSVAPAMTSAPAASVEINSANIPNQIAQWAIQIPGQPETAVTTEQLQFWAKSRAIRPETMVRDVPNNAMYPASQIPGVYSDKSYVTALLLSFFLGVLGIDRFYTGHIGLGIGKLLTGGGCGIWALVDLILYAMHKVNDSFGRPLR
jgi:TM2 domain-containing membrane protein YozV